MIAVRKRCRFRFGMRTLLFLPVLVGGVWWWSTWPERTSRRFVKLLTEGDVQAAQSMLATPRPAAETAFGMSVIAELEGGRFNSAGIQPRSIVDWLVARGDFGVIADHQKSRTYYGGFTACRGFVKPINGLEFQRMTLVYQFRYADNVFEKIKSDFTPNFPIMMVPIEENKVILSGSREGLDEFRKLAKRLDQESEDSKLRLDDVEEFASQPKAR